MWVNFMSLKFVSDLFVNSSLHVGYDDKISLKFYYYCNWNDISLNFTKLFFARDEYGVDQKNISLNNCPVIFFLAKYFFSLIVYVGWVENVNKFVYCP